MSAPPSRRPALRSLGPRIGLLVLALGAGSPPLPAADPPPAPGAEVELDRAGLGVGWVVWESNRSGAFRIWGRELRGRPPRRLSRDEEGREHCCARLSPDGTRLAYLSLPAGGRGYLSVAVPGELRVARLDGGAERTLGRTAHHYGEHRAVEWWSESVLLYLDTDGTTRTIDLARGVTGVVARDEPGKPGWLVDPSGRHAVGAIGFAERDPRSGAIHPLTPLGGCQHEITADGELGFWSAGAGGPIDLVDLATWRTRTLLRKNDPRLPAGRRYLYFPMLSRDRSLLAYAASGGDHDHFRADYDVYLFELDPGTVELRGPAIRVDRDPAVDRFPDVWRLAAPRPPSPATRPPVAAAPADTTAPVFLWRDAGDLNRRHAGAPSEVLEPHGESWTDRRGRLALAGGYFAASRDSAARLSSSLKASNSLTLSLLFEPAGANDREAGPLVSLAASPRARSLLLRRRGERLELVVRTAGRGGPAGGPPVELARLSDAREHHLAVRFSPGRLAAFLDGRPAARVTLPGDFYHWKERALLFGAEPGAPARFRGALSQIVVWDRELDDAEIAAEAARALATHASAQPVALLRVEARLIERSRVPSLEEISPYRRALAVERWQVQRVLEGESGATELRVAQWVLLDGERAARSLRPPGTVSELRLEPYAAQPQLENVVLSDTLRPDPEGPLYFDVGLGPP